MKYFNTLSGWLISISLPFVLIMFSIRVLFTPLFLVFEYNFPGFPSDSYGFTTEERLQWGRASMQYLFDRSDDSSLSDLKFEDGSQIYNEREISHMVDVKVLLLKSLNIFYAFIVVYIILILISLKSEGIRKIWHGLWRGGWLTVALIAAVLAGIAISFNQLFTLFHKLFFTGETWLFNYSDTLIRLFPMRLWQDAFIFMGIITLGLAILFIQLGRRHR